MNKKNSNKPVGVKNMVYTDKIKYYNAPKGFKPDKIKRTKEEKELFYNHTMA